MGTVHSVRLLPGRYLKSFVNTAPPFRGRKRQALEALGQLPRLPRPSRTQSGGSERPGCGGPRSFWATRLNHRGLARLNQLPKQPHGAPPFCERGPRSSLPFLFVNPEPAFDQLRARSRIFDESRRAEEPRLPRPCRPDSTRIDDLGIRCPG